MYRITAYNKFDITYKQIMMNNIVDKTIADKAKKQLMNCSNKKFTFKIEKI